jgi:hypothetical protein
MISEQEGCAMTSDMLETLPKGVGSLGKLRSPAA